MTSAHTPDLIDNNAIKKTFEPKVKLNGHGLADGVPSSRDHEHVAREALPFNVEQASEIKLTDEEYLIKWLLYEGDFSVFFGPSGSGKTFEILDIAHAVSVGRSKWGRRVNQAPVLICALEGARGLAKRVNGILRERGPAPDLIVYRGALDLLSDGRDTERLIATIKACGARLVVIDTLSRAMPGGDESGPVDMTSMVAAFGKISRATGAHVLVVHHTGKDVERGSRGHTSLKAAADVEVEIVKSNTGRRSMRFNKVKDGREGEEFAFELREIELGTDRDGDPITTCVVEDGGDLQHTKPVPRLSGFQAMVEKEMADLLANSDHTEHGIIPKKGMPRVTAVRRDQLSQELQHAGRFDSKVGEAMTAKDRGKLRDALAALEGRGVLCSSAEWVWRP